jgi:RNA polymerase sigma-70 factor (ECF subfamily)
VQDALSGLRAGLPRLEHLLREAEAAVTPHERLEQAQLASAVQRALTSLVPEHREVLLLRDLEGLSGDETARCLGVSVEAMKSRLHRARRALKLEIERPAQLH